MTFVLWSNAQQHETIVPLSSGENVTKTFSKEEILALEKLSDDFSGLPKIDLVNEEFPDGRLSVTEKWPEGAWGRGYATWPNVKFLPANAYGGFWSCHPMIRDVVGFMRGHLFLYKTDTTLTTSLRLIEAGIDYLLEEQIKTGKNKGAYIWYLKRAGQEDLNMEPPVNDVQPYETAHALVALSEYYATGINYRRDEVLTAIQLTNANLMKIKWRKDAAVGNTNLKALVIWALSASYRITNDVKTYERVLEIADFNLNNQCTDSTAENGVWLTGGKELIDGKEIHHDTKIFYHLMNIRGLMNTFSIIPENETELKWRFADGVKRGINHIINTRLDLSNRKNPKLRYGCLNTAKEKLPDWFQELVSMETAFETMSELYVVSRKNSAYFTSQESESILNLLNQCALNFKAENVWYFPSITIYIYYMNQK